MTDSLPDFCRRRAALSPHAKAFRNLITGESIDYAEFDRRAASAATMLRQLHVRAGDRVAMLCRNRIEFFELMFACAKIGAILVPLNWRMPADELSPLLEDAKPKILFYGTEDSDVEREIAAAGMSSQGLDDNYAGNRDACVPLHERDQWPNKDPWYLLYTSGTSGQPKAVVQTYGMAMANYVNIAQAMGICASDVTLNYLPLFHTAGINLVTMPTFIAGGEVLVLPGFDQERIMNLLSSGTLDTFFAVPSVYQQIGLDSKFTDIDLSNVRSFGCGGAPMPDELVWSFLDKGARVCNGMGMTETGPTVFLMDAASVEHKIGSVGKPQMLAAVRIINAEGRDVAPGETGELWFAGPGVTPGYWQRPDIDAEAFTADGWFKSGDLAYQDPDGFYFIVGRIKDMFISGGENVYPAEVEAVLAEHENILEAAVVARHDNKWGEVGHAYVLPMPDKESPSGDELAAYCRQHLAAYKIPKRFVAVTDFPRTAAGKIRKHLLAE